MADNEKPLEWIASSYKDLMALPPDVRRRFGYALSLAQMGDQDDAAKVLKGYGGAGVLEVEVFVRELGAVDGLAAGAVVVGEVASLAHEVGDDAVEGGALEAEALLAGAERAEVLCLGKFGVVEMGLVRL